MTRTAKLWIAVAVAAAAGIAADLVIGTYTAGLMMVVGFVGCAALILGAKALSTNVIKRPEDYYDRLAERTASDSGEERA